MKGTIEKASIGIIATLLTSIIIGVLSWTVFTANENSKMIERLDERTERLK